MVENDFCCVHDLQRLSLCASIGNAECLSSLAKTIIDPWDHNIVIIEILSSWILSWNIYKQNIGVFGNSTGLTDATCSSTSSSTSSSGCWAGGCSTPASAAIQLCQAGYYCPRGSISATQVQCGGAGKYVCQWSDCLIIVK